ncbi:MAG: glycerate kinase [Salinibacterium sp.]|nr:glycerate kinase [Salinibacterium sp.]
MTPASPLRVLIAPDSFKGSLSADAVAREIELGLHESMGRAVRTRAVPIADGGEGTLDVLLARDGAREHSIRTVDALGRPRIGRFGLLPHGGAVIEAAEANGLPHVQDIPLQPLEAHSYGVGLLVRAALDQGAEEILLTVGGSASTDAGVGLLRTLGARFLDESGAEVPPGGGSLAAIVHIDVSGVIESARQARWRVACDVDSPLTGPRGAAAVFGPQKGASPEDVATLDAGLRSFARLLRDTTGVDPAGVPGGGAAGGIPALLRCVFGAELIPGTKLVADILDLVHAVQQSDLVITGEGTLDPPSLRGKAPGAVAALARSQGVPVVALAGSVTLTPNELRDAGIIAAISLAEGPAELADLIANAPMLIRSAARRIGSLILLGMTHSTQSLAAADPLLSLPLEPTPVESDPSRTIKGEGSWSM